LHRCVKFHDTEYAVYGFEAPATAADGCGPADTGDGGVDDAERGPLVDAKDSEAAAEGGTPVRSAL